MTAIDPGATENGSIWQRASERERDYRNLEEDCDRREPHDADEGQDAALKEFPWQYDKPRVDDAFPARE